MDGFHSSFWVRHFGHTVAEGFQIHCSQTVASEGFRKPGSWLPLTVSHELQVPYLTSDITVNYTELSVRTTRTEELGIAVPGNETSAELSRRGNKGYGCINGMSLDA